jgi:hypothetical protein
MIATKEEIRAKLAAARKPEPKQCTVVMMIRPGHSCCGIKDSSCPILVLTGDNQAERAAAVVAKSQANPELEGDTFEAIEGVVIDEV